MNVTYYQRVLAFGAFDKYRYALSMYIFCMKFESLKLINNDFQISPTHRFDRSRRKSVKFIYIIHHQYFTWWSIFTSILHCQKSNSHYSRISFFQSHNNKNITCNEILSRQFEVIKCTNKKLINRFIVWRCSPVCTIDTIGHRKNKRTLNNIVIFLRTRRS